jgi:hypothetical protein
MGADLLMEADVGGGFHMEADVRREADLSGSNVSQSFQDKT